MNAFMNRGLCEILRMNDCLYMLFKTAILSIKPLTEMGHGYNNERIV